MRRKSIGSGENCITGLSKALYYLSDSYKLLISFLLLVFQVPKSVSTVEGEAGQIRNSLKQLSESKDKIRLLRLFISIGSTRVSSPMKWKTDLLLITNYIIYL
jgi:hypothetical protein